MKSLTEAVLDQLISKTNSKYGKRNEMSRYDWLCYYNRRAEDKGWLLSEGRCHFCGKDTLPLQERQVINPFHHRMNWSVRIGVCPGCIKFYNDVRSVTWSDAF